MRTLEHFPNLVTMFFTRAAEKGDAPFLWAKRDGQWVATSWAEAARQVSSLAAGLKAIGMNVELQSTDRSTLAARRPIKDHPDQNRGGWHIFHTTFGGAGGSTVAIGSLA